MASEFIAAAAKAIHVMTTPARDLTPEEAFKLVTALVSSGDLTLGDQVASYKAGQQLKIATTIAGVEFRQALGKNKGVNGSAGAVKTPFFFPTAPFAVVLHRLAVRLRDRWGASQIVWGGIGAGSGSHSLDCHMIGTCVDFYGATTSQGIFDVRRDWFLRPVTLKNGKRHALAPDDNDRWGNDNHTWYRLATSTDTKDLVAKNFFVDVYTFISEQCTFGRYDIAPDAFKNGAVMRAGYTLHPDYPIVDSRRHHNDHIHFQLGEAILKA